MLIEMDAKSIMYSEAIADPGWRDAIKGEVDSIRKNHI
jgi:hypothetical protein